MPRLTLNAEISQDALRMLMQAGQVVVLSKPDNNGGSPNVAWVAFTPLSANTVTWDEDYGIYASTTQIQNGAVIRQMSATPFPVLAGQTYSLTPQGNFGSPQGGGAPGRYAALNQYNNPAGLTFGLFQNAVVNGRPMNGQPVSAVFGPFQAITSLAPSSTAYIWVQQQVQSGTVVTNALSPQTRINFGGGVTQVTVVYDLNTGRFVEK